MILIKLNNNGNIPAEVVRFEGGDLYWRRRETESRIAMVAVDELVGLSFGIGTEVIAKGHLFIAIAGSGWSDAAAEYFIEDVIGEEGEDVDIILRSCSDGLVTRISSQRFCC